MAIQEERAREREQKQAEKDTRDRVAAEKRRATIADSVVSAMSLLQLIRERGSVVIQTFKVDDLKDLLLHADPLTPATKGKKEELRARVCGLDSVRKAITDYEAARSSDVTSTPLLAAATPPVPPATAVPPCLPPPDTSVESREGSVGFPEPSVGF